MAGGKETPRQKMIGMMYLVLTALLALNVSKDIIAAFVTLNDKLETSAEVIDNTSINTYGTFDSKRAAINAEKGDTKQIDHWQGKAEELKKKTKQTIHFFLSEANLIISEVEKVDSWILEKDENGLITELKSMHEIKAKDNFDAPTRRYVGGELMKPNPEGWALLDSIHAYRDYIAELMGNYELNKKKFTFKSPESLDGMAEALKTANPEDTSAILNFYKSLTIEREVKVLDAGKEKMYPWPSAMFDHAPVVAAGAILTSIRLDIKNAESHAAEFFLSKVDAPTFNFNKIEPLAFARTGYVNAGDSLAIKVMIAAYDSTEVPEIKFGVNETPEANWTSTTGAIKANTATPGAYKLNGIIGVKEKGETSWKPWSFAYTVGKPSGTVSLPEMNVLYRGYANKVEGAASGFPSYSISGGGNVDIKKTASGYIASPGSGREAVINISGVAEDGTSSNLGKFTFRVQNLPKPNITLGRIVDGESATSAELRAARQLFAGYPPEIPLNATFSIASWEVKVSGAPRPAKGNGGALNADAMRIIANATPGSTISIFTQYKEPSGRINRKSAVFNVK